MSNATTFTVRGHKVKSASQRRFVVVHVNREYETTHQRYVAPGQFVREPVTVPASARIDKRSDSIEIARAHQRRYSSRHGFAVVIDTTTGQEV